MVKHVSALAFIFVCTVMAWFILGGATSERTHRMDSQLRSEVGQLWGNDQEQKDPGVIINSYHERTVTRTIQEGKRYKTEEEVVVDVKNHEIGVESSNIAVDFKLHHRKKGLLWYAGYRVAFSAVYTVINKIPESKDMEFTYAFPSADCIYDDFSLKVNGKEIEDITPVKGAMKLKIDSKQGDKTIVEVSYVSQGLSSWWYTFNGGVSQIKNFSMTMTTDFHDIDFPKSGISPTEKKKTSDGYMLTWKYKNLISGIRIGLVMPQKINPGPFVSQISYFAPVSLFIFLFLMFIITAIRGIKIHPMNYFFISASFFSFHLLMAYLVDHIAIQTAFIISSVVSIGLVVSYMRLVVGSRFAIVETGLSQLVYLVLFSYTFFYKGFTGLIITIMCILTLFIVMQITGRLDWRKLSEEWNKNAERPLYDTINRKT